jgi:hypothetical protein
VLGISRAAEERAEFYIAHLTARRSVRLMPDEGRARRRIAGKGPSVPVWAPVELSRFCALRA